jgi:hypothetical protein
VAELQGLYGAFSFHERLLQKIWLRGDFNRAGSVLDDGRRLQILHPGRWNLLGGPDFRGARLRFADGQIQTGDVEVHLHASDWAAHGHARDPAYDGVVLHVILFPTEPRRPTLGVAGDIPVLTLLPLLHHALEEFAAEDAVEQLADHAASRLPDELGTLAPDKLQAQLRSHATGRWKQRVRFTKLRLENLGWEAACHHAALEILGYRFNRAPMLRLAGGWPLGRWRDAGSVASDAYAAEHGGWTLHGVRPANHPQIRLQQYAAWVQRRPDWPKRLLNWAAELPAIEVDADTRDVRRQLRLAERRAELAETLGAGQLSGSRFNTLVCDGFLPLLAAARRSTRVAGCWHHWFCGDLPSYLSAGLRQLGVFDGKHQPACHGVAQGLLGWLLARDAPGREPKTSA